MYSLDESFHISPRLRDALIADLMENDVDDEDAKWLLSEKRRRDEHECTEDLARQLGFRQVTHPVAHEVMLFLLPELDRLLIQWPPPTDVRECGFVVSHATQALRAGEVLGLLLAGPTSWSKHPLPDGATYGSIPQHCESAVRTGLTASLRDVLDRWTAWNVPVLHKQWQLAKDRRQAQPRPAPVQLSDEERARRRNERNRRNHALGFTPPGKTY